MLTQVHKLAYGTASAVTKVKCAEATVMHTVAQVLAGYSPLWYGAHCIERHALTMQTPEPETVPHRS